jgi:hypothetical protein
MRISAELSWQGNKQMEKEQAVIAGVQVEECGMTCGFK